MLLKLNERRLSVSKCLYLEKLLSTSTAVIGADLKSSGKHSLEASSPFRIFKIVNIV